VLRALVAYAFPLGRLRNSVAPALPVRKFDTGEYAEVARCKQRAIGSAIEGLRNERLVVDAQILRPAVLASGDIDGFDGEPGYPSPPVHA
jgi:hypothetical protein